MRMPAHTKIMGAIVGVLLLCLTLKEPVLLIPEAYAQTGVVPDTNGGIMGMLLFAIAILNFLAFLLLKFLSFLIDPLTIFGVNGSGDKILLRLWQISRDIMNLLFAMMLLAGAIITIVFGKQEIVKQHIAKFLLAVVLVNFSWFFPRVIMDLANVTTATIYGLPNLVGSQCQWIDENGSGNPCVVITDILFAENITTGTCPTPAVGPPIPPMDIGSVMRICLARLDNTTNNGFGIINGLVANHGRLLYLGVITGSPPSGGLGGTAAGGARFMIILAMVTFLHMMLVFPLAALTMVMIIRIPILWLTVAFMPFMFIGFVIGDKFIKVNSMEIFTKHFITAAFLPALVAIPFSVGYIMLNEVAAISISDPSSIPAGLSGKIPFFSQAQNWWQAIWILLAFMVMWMGSRFAMKRDEIYSKFTEPIFNVGNSFLKLPLAIPIPVGKDEHGNIKKQSLSDIGRNLQSNTGLATQFGLRDPFDAKDKAKQSANNPDVQNALTRIHASDGAAANEVKLLRDEMKRQNHTEATITPQSAREFVQAIKNADAQKPVGEQKLGSITNIEKIANAIANPNVK